MKPPIRIRDDRSAPPGLASDLDLYSHVTHPYDAAAGWDVLQRSIQSEAPRQLDSPKAETAATSGDSLSHALLAKLAAAGLVVVAAASWIAIANPVSRKTSPSSTSPSAAAAPKHVVPPIEERVTSERLPPPVSDAAPVTTPQKMAGETAVAPRPQRIADDDASRARREISQLARIRELLDHKPRTALRIAEAGHREFGLGTLYQEREALAIMAMWSLRDVAQAEKRTRAFFTRYPHSPFRAHIETLQSKAAGNP